MRLTVEGINSMPKIVTSSDCWIPAGTSPHRRLIQVKHRQHAIGRVVLHILNKNLDINDHSWEACHKIICKDGRCFNPNHLYAGSHQENMMDAILAGTQHQVRKTHCPKGHPLSGKNLYVISDSKRRWRRCMTCIREQRAKQKDKRKIKHS